MSPSMQRFMKAQSADSAGMTTKANLEINAKHPVIKKLSSMIALDGENPSYFAAKNYAKLVYEMAALSSGWELLDPASFAKRVAALMEGGDAALEGLKDDDDDDGAKDNEVTDIDESEEENVITPE